MNRMVDKIAKIQENGSIYQQYLQQTVTSILLKPSALKNSYCINTNLINYTQNCKMSKSASKSKIQ